MYEKLISSLRICQGMCEGSGFEEAAKLLTQAADAIEELEKSIPRWIPVNERPPEELAEVNIAWMNTAPAPYYDFIKGKTFTGSAVYYKGQWFWYSAVCRDYLSEYGFSPNDSMDDAIKVTHWMPLPEPPKEE